MTEVFGTAGGFHALMACDTLLLLGRDFAWRQFYPDHARIVQIDIDPSHLGRRHPVEIGAMGDVRATLETLVPRLRPRKGRDFLDDCLKRHNAAVRTLDKRTAVGRSGAIHPQCLTHLIDQQADDDAVFIADGGSPMVWMLRHIRATRHRRTIASLTHGTMANAMPQALGAKKAFPNRQVISLSGDGGLSMLLGDLITAVQERIPIKITVYNNSSLAFVELEMKVEGMLDSYTNLDNPHFARVAQAICFHAQRVEKAEDLEAAVRDWLGAPGPALLDVVTDRMELVMPPKIEFGEVFGTALYSAKALLAGRTGDLWELATDSLD